MTKGSEMSFIMRLVFLFSVLLVFAGAGFSSSQTKCSNATLKGSFGFVLSGKNLGLGKDYVLMGRFDADGKGSYKGSGSQSVGGHFARGEFFGTYTVSEDCTGAANITFPASGAEDKLEFVVVSDGNEVYLLDVGGTTVEFGTAKKIFRKNSHE